MTQLAHDLLHYSRLLSAQTPETDEGRFIQRQCMRAFTELLARHGSASEPSQGGEVVCAACGDTGVVRDGSGFEYPCYYQCAPKEGCGACGDGCPNGCKLEGESPSEPSESGEDGCICDDTIRFDCPVCVEDPDAKEASQPQWQDDKATGCQLDDAGGSAPSGIRDERRGDASAAPTIQPQRQGRAVEILREVIEWAMPMAEAPESSRPAWFAKGLAIVAPEVKQARECSRCRGKGWTDNGYAPIPCRCQITECANCNALFYAMDNAACPECTSASETEQPARAAVGDGMVLVPFDLLQKAVGWTGIASRWNLTEDTLAKLEVLHHDLNRTLLAAAPDRAEKANG